MRDLIQRFCVVKYGGMSSLNRFSAFARGCRASLPALSSANDTAVKQQLLHSMMPIADNRT